MTDEGGELRSYPVDYSIDDFQALAKQADGYGVRRLRLMAFLLFILAIPTIAIELQVAPAAVEIWPIVLQLALAIVFYLVSSSRFRAHLWHKLASRSPFFASYTFAVTPGALVIASAKARSEVLWSAMPRLISDEGRLFLFMNRRMAYIIPQRAFASEADFNVFATAAMDRWKQARR